MQIPYKQNLLKGLNLDLDETRVDQAQAIFIKNMNANVSANPDNSAAAGSNAGVYTPLESNAQLRFSLPGGNNFCIGFYNSTDTNEGYAFIFNDHGNHVIYVIRGDSGLVQVVYQGDALGFVLEPKYFISEGRCALALRNYVDKVTGQETNFKFLMFTNNYGNQYWISVEDSIATSSYTTPTSYFAGAGTFYDPSILIHFGMPSPLKCIGITPVAVTDADLEKQNLIVKNAYQFRAKWINVFETESEHGYPSNVYMYMVGGSCAGESNGMPRCLDLTIDAGHPTVDKIQIEYRLYVGSELGSDITTGWLLYDVIDKWNNTTGLRWYQRSLNPDLNYDPVANTITYRFCADKNNEAIDRNETSRTQSGLALKSSGLALVNNKVILSNNVRDFEPILPIISKEVSLSVSVPSTYDCASMPKKNIRFYSNIYRPYNDSSGIIRNSFDTVVWGNEDGTCGDATANSFRVDQVFGDQDSPGFIAYLAGTDNKVIGVYGYFDITTHIFTPLPTYTTPPAGMEPMIEFSFNVDPGVYVARLSSHKAIITDADLKTTSTTVAGIVNLNTAFSSVTGAHARQAYAANPIKELVLDCTLGDVVYNTNTSPMFLIMDLSGTGCSAIDGYLYEQAGQSIPVEMAPVSFQSTYECYGSFFTDHNGYYFGLSGNLGLLLKVYYDLCDGAGAIMQKSFTNTDTHIVHGDGTGTPTGTGACTFGGLGAWRNRTYLTSSPMSSFSTSARRVINQKVLLCGTSTGIPGITMVMTKGATAFTDGSGKARIVAHNRYNYAAVVAPLPTLAIMVPNYAIAPLSTDYLVFTQRGYCKWYSCSGGCYPALDNAAVVYDGGCCSPYPTCVRSSDMPSVTVYVAGVNIKGPATGARYPWGYVLFDKIGRHTAVQRLPGELGFISTPNINDETYRRFILPQINFSIGSGFVVPGDFVMMKIVIGENTIFSDSISWAADWVEFCDQAGNPTAAAGAKQIRIYWASLNEYNKQANFSTNSTWQIQTTADNLSSPMIGDVVQLIKNGDGAWFPSVTSAPITYNTNKSFFTIQYSNDLASLVNGALFRIIRPKQNQNSFIYFGQCLDIPLVNGVPQVTSGRIDFFDSYMLTRLIPVPIPKGQAGPIPPGGTPSPALQYTSSNNDSTLEDYADNNDNSNGVVIMSLVDYQTSFPFLFEGPSPSDYWGDHVKNHGLPYFANPYEGQKRIGTEVAPSNKISDRGSFNGLAYFESNDIVLFDKNTWGDITVLLVEVGRCLVICNSDHFYIDYNTTALTSTPTGVKAQNQYGMFDAPQRNPGTPFGCPMFNINTIRQHLGIVMWLDGSGRIIQSTFGTSKFIDAGYSGYLKNKLAVMNELNMDASTGITYPVAGIDPKGKEYHLTFFNAPVNYAASYINAANGIDLYANETLIIDLATGILKSFVGFTPEYYGTMERYYTQENMLTFKHGSGWLHHSGVDGSDIYNNFYGVQVRKTLTVVVNPKPDKVKRFMYTEVYCSQHLFIVTSARTESGQVSRISKALWDRRDKFYCSDYKCDLNTIFDPAQPAVVINNPLYEGNTLYGRWMKVTYESDDTTDPLYCEVSSVVNYFIEETNSAE